MRTSLAVCGACVLLSCARPEPDVRVVFAGDLLLDRGVAAQAERRGLAALLTPIRPVLSGADFVFVNFECPATDIRAPLSKRFCFRADPALLPGLAGAGVTHLILANNHSVDQGREGLIDTYANADAAGLGIAGFGSDQASACRPVELLRGNLRIAVFSSVLLPLENWPYLADRAGVCQATCEQLSMSIREYRSDNPSATVVVSLHWGAEYRPLPQVTQRDQARMLSEAGADLIVGHHPHVVQSISRIGSTVVCYSLGNFMFDNPREETHKGLLVVLDVTGTGRRITLAPYRQDRCSPVLLNGRDLQAFGSYLESISGTLRLRRKGKAFELLPADRNAPPSSSHGEAWAPPSTSPLSVHGRHSPRACLAACGGPHQRRSGCIAQGTDSHLPLARLDRHGLDNTAVEIEHVHRVECPL